VILHGCSVKYLKRASISEEDVKAAFAPILSLGPSSTLTINDSGYVNVEFVNTNNVAFPTIKPLVEKAVSETIEFNRCSEIVYKGDKTDPRNSLEQRSKHVFGFLTVALGFVIMAITVPLLPLYLLLYDKVKKDWTTSQAEALKKILP
jgi:hypothetical protein